MVNKKTGKPLEKNEDGQEIFKCPECGEIHIVDLYVYAQMSIHKLTHACDCGFKTGFYRDEMYQKL